MASPLVGDQHEQQSAQAIGYGRLSGIFGYSIIGGLFVKY
jgi:hypothetical protein